MSAAVIRESFLEEEEPGQAFEDSGGWEEPSRQALEEWREPYG